MRSADDVLVIGAGPAGLAVAACLRRAGVPHRVLEREASVGASWRRHYDRLHLHTPAAHSALPMTPWPAGTPRYPSRDRVVDYLERHAAAHRIAPDFGVEVRAVRRDGPRFVVETDRGVLRPRHVVMATGANRVPRRPGLPGLERFGGTVVHSADYRNADGLRGLRTLVVGCGNSGAEIALDLAERGVDVALAVRGPVHVVPRDLLGLLPAQQVAILLAPLPIGLRDAIAAVTLRLAVGDLSRWGIDRPAAGPNRTLAATGRVPLLDIGTLAAIRDGRIAVRPGVAEVLPAAVRFVDARVQPVEAIVLATGYDNGLAGLVDGFATMADPLGRPPGHVDGLHFLGFSSPLTGQLRQIARDAPAVARRIAR